MPMLKASLGPFRRLRTPALLFLTMLAQSCATLKIPAPPPAPAPVIVSSPVKAVPCVELPVIRFHAPTNLPDTKAWLAGALPDPTNAYDTPGTVDAIRKLNAARGAVCGP